MNNFVGDNINAIRVHYGLSQADFGEAVGVSQTTVSAWECGDSTPRKANVDAVVEAFPGITFDDVMGEMDGYARRASRRTPMAEVPVYGSIAAGAPLEMLAVEDTGHVPPEVASAHPRAFFLRVKGESMNRILPDGCLALVDPCETVERPGQPYAVCVDGCEATVKRVRPLANGFELSPDSTDPTYKPVVYDYGVAGTETITVIGRVVWHAIPANWAY